ncbi:unnamed protein product, partial [Iphiclides podalirius]
MDNSTANGKNRGTSAHRARNKSKTAHLKRCQALRVPIFADSRGLLPQSERSAAIFFQRALSNRYRLSRARLEIENGGANLAGNGTGLAMLKRSRIDQTELASA